VRVLIVDDDVGILHTLMIGLTSCGFQVISAKDGYQALSFIESSNKDPVPVTLMVTDLKMPGIDGIDLIKKARALSPSLLAVLVTAYGDDQVRDEVRELNHCVYLEKPFTPNELLEVIKDVVEQSEGKH
jgi:DNA-binding response OmpR family regulator